MAEHDGNGDGGITPEDKLEQSTTLLKLEEQRLDAAKKRLETNRDDALQQGEILKALQSTIELEKQKLRFQQEFVETEKVERDVLQKQIEILDAQENLLNKSAAAAKRLFKDSGAANFAEDIARAAAAEEGLVDGLKKLGTGLDTTTFKTRALGRALISLGVRGFRTISTQTKNLVKSLDAQRA